MIKELDWQFLKGTAKALDVFYPDDWIDSFNDIYRAMVVEALDNIWMEDNDYAKDYILDNIYYNYMDTRVDLSVDKFLEEHPQYKDKREELENILY